MQPFVFHTDIGLLHGEGTRFVDVPAGLSDKRALLSWYAEALRFPRYFGANWDAFDECLRDLSWIKERRLVLYHRDLPLKASSKDQKIYIEVLADAVRDWKPGEAHEVVAAFDPACKQRLQSILCTS